MNELEANIVKILNESDIPVNEKVYVLKALSNNLQLLLDKALIERELEALKGKENA